MAAAHCSDPRAGAAALVFRNRESFIAESAPRLGAFSIRSLLKKGLTFIEICPIRYTPV
jgi:hypothetical protein